MPITFDLDRRCQEILKILVNANGYVQIGDLSEQLDVSRRSIYYDINKIDDWLRSRSLSALEQKRGKGIAIHADQAAMIRKSLFERGADKQVSYTPEERRSIILCMIVIRSRNLYIEDFMETCDVSRNTIVKDLKLVADIVETNQLTLEYRIKTGYRIFGDPIRKRAMFFYYYPQVWKYFSTLIFSESQNQRIQRALSNFKKIEEELDCEYVSGVLPGLATFLSTIEYRSDVIDFSDMDRKEIISTKEYQLVRKYFPSLSDQETIYISLHLLGSRLQVVPLHVLKQDESKAYEYARSMVKSFETLSGVEFEDKEELINAIATHLKSSLYRIRYGVQWGNPMLETIKKEYGELFDLTKRAVENVEAEMGMTINDTEVAYIALHFGAFMTPLESSKHSYRILIICPNGIGAGNMLKNEVRSMVPQATEIKNISLNQYRPDHNYDVVISTVDLPGEKDFLLVHPILSEQDRVSILRKCMELEPSTQIQMDTILKIVSRYVDEAKMPDLEKDLRTAFSNGQMSQPPIRDYGLGLLHFLTPTHLQIVDEPCNRKDALRRALRPLLMNDAITRQYIESVVQAQENHHQMFIANEVVLAHSGIDNGVKQVDVAITLFRHPVPFENGMEARIILGLSAEDQIKHIHVMNDILRVFSKKDNIAALERCKDKETMYQTIHKILKGE